MPEVWILGSSNYGAQVAAHFGLPYCFAYFFSEGIGAREALDIYRDTYKPSTRHPRPYSAICVLAMAADSQADAERLYVPREVWRAERERGRFVPLPSATEASAYVFTDAEQRRNDALRPRALYGTPDIVRARMTDVATDLGVDEVAVCTATHDADDRRRSYELIADAFGLRAEPAMLAAD
jgi:luciferase family oxidoreductase group 1